MQLKKSFLCNVCHTYIFSQLFNRLDVSVLLRNLHSQIDMGNCPTHNLINVCRDDIMGCAVRALEPPLLNPLKKIDVMFVDDWEMSEGAVDDGGSTREFCRLLMP